MTANTKKGSPIFIVIFILIIGTIIYNYISSEPETYLTKGIDRINSCIKKTYSAKSLCSSTKIDNRDVYSCSINSTKLVYEIQDMGQDSFFVYALNGKARQLSQSGDKSCLSLESLDYDFINKVL